jgi:hypothetical protein
MIVEDPDDNNDTIDQQTQSALFRLPVELRLHIYELHFRLKDGQRPYGLGLAPKGPRLSSLSLLLTCRRTLAEAETIFYSVNRLSITDAYFINSIGVKRREAISKVSIPTSSAAAVLSALQQLRLAPNLKSIVVCRQVSVKYIDVRSWRVMAPQLITELSSMENLQDLSFQNPIAVNLSDNEKVREAELRAVDDRLRGAVKRSNDQ